MALRSKSSFALKEASMSRICADGEMSIGTSMLGLLKVRGSEKEIGRNGWHSHLLW